MRRLDLPDPIRDEDIYSAIKKVPGFVPRGESVDGGTSARQAGSVGSKPTPRSTRIVPLVLRQANELVATLHRHHKPLHTHRFSIGLEADGRMVGAAICQRPASLSTDQYSVLEVARLVTDGTPNACSLLYGACARIAKEMGFDQIQTFILSEEPGTSLKASGWELDGHTSGDTWDRPNIGRRRKEQHPLGPKQRWVKRFRKKHA
jgi:hypothetical protein